MAHVITQNCCKDASCVPVCPVDCIRPVGGPGAQADMLYIDPDTCIDCGACMDECPVDAIHYEDDLPPEQLPFKDINAAYFRLHPLEPAAPVVRVDHPPVPTGSLRVAIVGSGPAACYAAGQLIGVENVEVTIFERLATPFGLIRAGVAPDHQNTKKIVQVFDQALRSDRMHCYLNVEVGNHVSHAELMKYHHAVLYAVGAHQGRRLGINGEQLPGVHSAAEFVGWYNAHPDLADHPVDLSGRRAVIIGNGNVALDVARLLVMGHDDLSRTDVADHALNALDGKGIEEVVVLARRGIRHAAFSVGEFLALGELDGVDIVIEGDSLDDDTDGDDVGRATKIALARQYRDRERRPGNKRIVFRFGVSPAAVTGEEHADGLLIRTVDRPDDIESIDTSLIVTSIGYRSVAIDGLPYDSDSGLVPNEAGRVLDESGQPVPGAYVTGWVKRGPRGVIGANRSCAAETVAAVLADFDHGVLQAETASAEQLDRSLLARGAAPLTWRHWQAVDAAERRRGAEADRPRVKFIALEDIIGATR